MTASETWKRRRIQKEEKQKEMVYICHAYSVWDCDGHGRRKTESKAFEATDAGWNQAQKWMRKFSDKWWNVTLVKARRD